MHIVERRTRGGSKYYLQDAWRRNKRYGQRYLGPVRADAVDGLRAQLADLKEQERVQRQLERNPPLTPVERLLDAQLESVRQLAWATLEAGGCHRPARSWRSHRRGRPPQVRQ
jgi:hypothetical protein